MNAAKMSLIFAYLATAWSSELINMNDNIAARAAYVYRPTFSLFLVMKISSNNLSAGKHI